MGITVSSSKKKLSRHGQDGSLCWWAADKGSATAMALGAWMDNIEQSSWTRRWANLVYYRYITGRSAVPASFNFSATSRPSSAKVYARAQFEPPRYNVLMQCGDALANRVYKAQPFLQVCPIDGDSNARFNARYLTRFMDASFFDLDLWPMVEIAGADARTWGDGFIKVDVSLDGKAIEATRILSDEVIIDDNECNAGEPRNYSIRLFVSKDALLEQFGDNPEACEAILNAPRSENGFYFGDDIDFTDIVVLREAWHCQRGNGKGLNKGRHVLSVGRYCFTDEEYKREKWPVMRLPFKLAQTGYFSRGMPEMALGLQREVDRVMGAAWENFRRAAWPRIGIAVGSNVDPAKLADRSNGIYTWAGGAGMAPKFDFPQAMSADMFRHLEDTIRRIKDMFRLSEHSITGQDFKLTSGVAKTKQNEIDDAAHVDLSLHLERAVEDLGGLIIQAAEQCKPKVMLPGRNAQLIDWNTLKWSDSSFYLRAFPVGRLSQSIAVKQQQIDTWFAEGAISKETKMRLEQVPDTDGYQTLANAGPDFVEYQLDLMIEKNRYEPPEPWLDPDVAQAMAQSRYLFEKRLGTPQDRTDKILMYLSALDEMKSAVSSVTAGPAPGGPAPGMPGPGPGGTGAGIDGAAGFGIQPPPGAGPAPPPFPLAPGMGKPGPVQ